ncbi:MAG: hypothetical protein JSU88_01105 [Nitrospinaceae bacterium]|jgi:hypothetical protein|nr:MAG: hypothetical protein JSU88_01105 [Nitrospinaceae bacterium]
MGYKAVIKKDRIDAIIRTSGEIIEGTVHKLPQNRLLDMLNKDSDTFIPVSNAKVYNLATEKFLFETDFIAVNKNHVVVIADNTDVN